MARSRNPNKRGTRLWGPISGTTFQTQPSGITIGPDGITVSAGTVDYTELSYLDEAGGDVLACDKGTGFSITGASVAWAGTTLQISHGFTTLQGISAVFSGSSVDGGGTAVSPATCHIIQSTGGDVNSMVSAVVVQRYHGRVVPSGDSVGLVASGGTVFWMAFGK